MKAIDAAVYEAIGAAQRAERLKHVFAMP